MACSPPRECWTFFWFPLWFQVFPINCTSSHKMAKAFNRCGATQVVALDISKAFERVCYVGTFHKLKSYEWILWIQVAFDWKFLHKYPVNAGVPQGSILDPTIFLLYINDCPDDVICNIAVYDDDNSLYQKCDQTSNLWQQLELTWIWSTRPCGLGKELTYWFQYWKKTTGFVWLV